MKQMILMFVGALLFAGCANDAAQRSPQETSARTAGNGAALNGERHYKEYCAGCHETGMLGAPITENSEDWADRSQLWDAILLDHAITGYFEMPAKGGRMNLPDDVVKSAAEHMLRMTYPDRLQDCNPPVCDGVDD
ncbi:MAG: c-type cytochrome [Gammaproteobacteria bacterium]|nr:c-type cytochrome [Gammaproteobacteria bacterium]